MGVRGYVFAYGAATGNLAWRFYTVRAILRSHLKCRSWKKRHKLGEARCGRTEGETVWDAMAFDPQLDAVHRPGNADLGDGKSGAAHVGISMLVSSNRRYQAGSGIRWHFRKIRDTGTTTPRSTLILADLRIDGQLRRF